MNILILEDEAQAARELQNFLQTLIPQAGTAVIINSVEKAIDYLQQQLQPDLVFSDIQLADGSFFDILQTVNLESPVIFCSAFDEYTLRAFDTNAISYILKPVTVEKVTAALEKFYRMRSLFKPPENLQTLYPLGEQAGGNYKTKLLIDYQNKIIPLNVDDIAFFYLDKSIVKVITVTEKKYFIAVTLNDLEQMLNPLKFYRANRQFLVNKTVIENVEKNLFRKLIISLRVSVPETIVISKDKATDFLKWLEY